MAKEQGQLYALLVGVNEYESTLRPLQFAVADVLEFRNLLFNRMGLKPEHYLLLVSGQSTSVAPPRRAEVFDALERFANMGISESDTFIFYFAGHGFTVQDRTFLMTVDAKSGSRKLLERTALSLAELEEFARSIRAGQQLLILDACRNEPRSLTRGSTAVAEESSMGRDIITLAKGVDAEQDRVPVIRRSRSILSACWDGSCSYEWVSKGHSWFCHHLLEAFEQAPAGTVEISPDWVEQMGERMRQNAPLLFPEAARQEPHIELQGRPIRLRLAPVARARAARRWTKQGKPGTPAKSFSTGTSLSEESTVPACLGKPLPTAELAKLDGAWRNRELVKLDEHPWDDYVAPQAVFLRDSYHLVLAGGGGLFQVVDFRTREVVFGHMPALKPIALKHLEREFSGQAQLSDRYPSTVFRDNSHIETGKKSAAFIQYMDELKRGFAFREIVPSGLASIKWTEN